MNELVSVIIPVWKPNMNHFEKCIQSIINQSYNQLEIIISYRPDDNENEFIKKINSYNDNRIKILKNHQKGFTNSLNEAIKIANGKFIARIDADDYCNIERIEKQIEFKKTHNFNIVGTWAILIDEYDNEIGKIETPHTHEEIRNKMMIHNPILHPSVLLEKKIFEQIGIYDTKFNGAEDYEFWFRAIFHKLKIGNVPEFLTYLRETPDSITRGSEWKKQRRMNIKVKNYAFRNYGFNSIKDTIFHIVLTPLTYFVSPSKSVQAKRFLGWYK